MKRERDPKGIIAISGCLLALFSMTACSETSEQAVINPIWTVSPKYSSAFSFSDHAALVYNKSQNRSYFINLSQNQLFDNLLLDTNTYFADDYDPDHLFFGHPIHFTGGIISSLALDSGNSQKISRSGSVLPVPDKIAYNSGMIMDLPSLKKELPNMVAGAGLEFADL